VLRVVKGDERGGREIIQEQAETVNRVFSEFTTGMSPNQIAHGLNHDALASSTKMVAGVGLNLGRTKSW
jgi:hypothetical protein